MIFCPNCGTKLVLKNIKDKENTILEYQCSRCGYSVNDVSNIRGREHLIKKHSASEEPIIIIDDKALELKTMSTYRIECPRCHNDIAFTWQVQTRSGDEGSTQFFRCTECNHTWRLYT